MDKLPADLRRVDRTLWMMNGIARLQGMTDTIWQRHANPLSGWTRVPVLPLFAVAGWSRVWIGWWCLVPIALLLVWAYVNPRVFPKPRTTDSWMSKAVMGERIWLGSDTIPVPAHHDLAARTLNAVGLLGVAPLIWGILLLDPWATTLGLAVAMLAKLWFLDRMVWLFSDVAQHHDRYRHWLY